MTLLSRFESLPQLEQGAAIDRCSHDLAAYMAFVHGWEPRAHQRAWVRALQALEIAPGCWGTEHPVCECVGEHVCDACFECRVHESKELSIEAFVGSGKTDTLIEFMAWVIGRDPESAALAVFSYNDTVAQERSMAVRDTLHQEDRDLDQGVAEMSVAERYALVFPGIRPADNKSWGQDRLFVKRKNVSKKDPSLVACGLEGSVTARRLTGIVLDDPHNMANTATAYERAKVRKVLNFAAKTRLIEGGWKVSICPPWTADEESPDLPGYFRGQGWPVLRTPALDDRQEPTWPFERPGFGFTKKKLLGEQERDPVSFMFQYQCVAVPDEEEAQLRPPASTPAWREPASFARIIQIWDTASATKAHSSETAGITLGRTAGGETWLLDVVAERIPVGEIMSRIVQKEWEFESAGKHVEGVHIEQASSGHVFIPMLRQNTPIGRKIWPITVGGAGRTREDRIQASARRFPEVKMRDNAPWKQKVVNQILSYSANVRSRDDIVTCLAHGLNILFPPRAVGAPPRVRTVYSGWDYE